MMQVPELTDDALFAGSIEHMPEYSALPDDFKRHNGNDYCKAISKWFFRGAEPADNGMIIDGVKFTAKPGIDRKMALRAIKAVLCSFEPKHEHKEAACAFMLSEWFDKAE